ncbi:hypothetical protein LCGC14_0385370 [marine sediment metagenome]|uniref:Fibronectin type-III domain-containing protein n=1 Tax=marine sediment metagenome TaxID=412755 RepID=A0A0F9T190_9ZZZZ
MAIEDFNTYSETDPGSMIVKGTRRVEWTDLTRNKEAYVWKDKTAGFFDGDFTHYLTIRVTADLSESNAQFNYWALANVVDEWKGIEDASEDMLAIAHSHPTSPDRIELNVIEVDGGARYGSVDYVMTLNTNYYLKIVRDESVGTYGTIYCYIYSDAARTTLLATISVTLHSSKKDFRYIYGVMTYNGATPHKASAYSEDLELLASLETPSVTTLSMTDYATTTITGNGVINSLGLSAVTAHGHAWNTTIDPVTGDNNVDNGTGSLGVFTSAITGLIDGQTYWARAYATNSEGTTYGANVKFTTNRSNLELIPGEYSIKGEKLHYVSKTGKEYEVQGIAV